MRGLPPRFVVEEGLFGEGVADDADDPDSNDSNPDDSDSDPGSLSLSLRESPTILAYSGSTGRSKTLKSTSRNDMLALIVDLVFLILSMFVRFTNLLFIFRLFVRSGYFVNFILLFL